MKKKLRSFFVQVLFLLLAFYLSYRSIQEVPSEDWEKIGTSLKLVNPFLVLLGVGLILAGVICRSERWLIVIDQDKPRSFSFRRSLIAFGAVMFGYMINTFIPRLGEVMRCTALAKYEKQSSVLLVGTIILERLFDLICLFLLFIVVFSFESSAIISYLKILFQEYWQRFSLWYIVLLFILVGLFFLVIKWLRTKNPKWKGLAQDLKNGFFSFRYIKRKGDFLFWTIVMWFFYVASIRFSFLLFDDLQQLTWGVALEIVAIGSIAMILTQGGMGAYPLMITQLLIFNGLPAHSGFTLGWFSWVLMSLVNTAVGIGSYYFIIRKTKTI